MRTLSHYMEKSPATPSFHMKEPSCSRIPRALGKSLLTVAGSSFDRSYHGVPELSKSHLSYSRMPYVKYACLLLVQTVQLWNGSLHINRHLKQLGKTNSGCSIRGSKLFCLELSSKNEVCSSKCDFTPSTRHCMHLGHVPPEFIQLAQTIQAPDYMMSLLRPLHLAGQW